MHAWHKKDIIIFSAFTTMIINFACITVNTCMILYYSNVQFQKLSRTYYCHEYTMITSKSCMQFCNHLHVLCVYGCSHTHRTLIDIMCTFPGYNSYMVMYRASKMYKNISLIFTFAFTKKNHIILFLHLYYPRKPPHHRPQDDVFPVVW